jgi:hypothetical protein
MEKNPITTNSEELELFRGLLRVAIEREHALLPQVINVARLVAPGDWVRVAALARGLNEASEEFYQGLCGVAEQHSMLPRGAQLFPVCTVCGGSWCGTPSVISQSIVLGWQMFVADNKKKEEED